MANYEAARRHLMIMEGGLSNRLDDPGGITNYGVSLRWLQSVGEIGADGFLIGDLDQDGDVDADDIRAMTPEKSAELYRSQWWDRYRYGSINDQAIATKIFDFAVNMGPRQAHILAQRALRATGKMVVEDGILGLITLQSINDFAPRGILPALRSEAAGFYRSLNKPTFINGWLNRAYA